MKASHSESGGGGRKSRRGIAPVLLRENEKGGSGSREATASASKRRKNEPMSAVASPSPSPSPPPSTVDARNSLSTSGTASGNRRANRTAAAIAWRRCTTVFSESSWTICRTFASAARGDACRSVAGLPSRGERYSKSSGGRGVVTRPVETTAARSNHARAAALWNFSGWMRMLSVVGGALFRLVLSGPLWALRNGRTASKRRAPGARHRRQKWPDSASPPGAKAALWRRASRVASTGAAATASTWRFTKSVAYLHAATAFARGADKISPDTRNGKIVGAASMLL
mmetsp:Transcript_23603/g.61606  ORF Transcript_23603/g.61606 Transcript_23603/m.61606 type:complete len:285 (-) Transcript_23603:733-1587(-)